MFAWIKLIESIENNIGYFIKSFLRFAQKYFPYIIFKKIINEEYNVNLFLRYPIGDSLAL